MKRLFAWLLVVLMLATAAGCGSEDTPESDTFEAYPTVQTYDELDEDEKTIIRINNAPIFSLKMVEKPEVSMWEFIHGVDKYDDIVIAELVSEDTRAVYDVSMYRVECYTKPAYRYYIRVMKESSWVDEPSFCFEVTENNIDEAWLSMEACLLMYNSVCEQIQLGEVGLENSVGSVYSYLEGGMLEYQEEGFIDTEMVVAAAYNEQDWLYDFYVNRVEVVE